MQAQKIDVSLVDHVERAGLGRDLVQRPQVVGFGVRHPQKHGDSHAQVEHRVGLDPALASAEARPGKQRQAQVDRRRVQRVGVGIQRRDLRVHRQLDPRGGDHHHGGVHEDPVIAILVGLRQRAARHAAADAAAVVTSRAQSREARNGFAQAPPPGDLREDHAQQLVRARQSPRATIASIAAHGTLERAAWKKFDQLRKDAATLIHERIVVATRPDARQNRRLKLKSCTPSSVVKTSLFPDPDRLSRLR